MKWTLVVLLVTITTLNACILNHSADSQVDNSICNKYNVYYNSLGSYYLVVSKKNSLVAYNVWQRTKGLYLENVVQYYYLGPFESIDEAIERYEKDTYLYNTLISSAHKKYSNTLIRKEDGTILENLCGN